ncbi:MAG TPA: hypothetical protein VL625_07450 [Patescibacteria group bacterium]|nr:hypothetical protein [Patescibacteria group bacterium]
MFGKKAPATPEVMALGIASQFGFDLNEITETFKGNESGLRNLFNKASEARHDRIKYGLETVGLTALTAVTFGLASVVTVPAAAYTGYKTYESNKTLNWVSNQVQAEIEKKHTAPATSPAPGPVGS